MQETLETWVQSLRWEDPLEEEMATHSILTWKISWTEEPSGLRSMGSQKVEHNLATKRQQHSASLEESGAFKWTTRDGTKVVIFPLYIAVG